MKLDAQRQLEIAAIGARRAGIGRIEHADAIRPARVSNQPRFGRLLRQLPTTGPLEDRKTSDIQVENGDFAKSPFLSLGLTPAGTMVILQNHQPIRFRVPRRLVGLPARPSTGAQPLGCRNEAAGIPLNKRMLKLW